MKKTPLLLPFISLFFSVSTLICCALPALLVTLGLGATLAGLISTAPWLVTISRYKAWFFIIAGVLLFFVGLYLYYTRHLPCPTDPMKARACRLSRRISVVTVVLSGVIYIVGIFFAYFAIYFIN